MVDTNWRNFLSATRRLHNLQIYFGRSRGDEEHHEIFYSGPNRIGEFNSQNVDVFRLNDEPNSSYIP